MGSDNDILAQDDIDTDRLLTPVRKEWDSMKIMRVKDWVKVPALIVKRVVRYNDFTGQVKEII